jgi:hypothetical protein
MTLVCKAIRKCVNNGWHIPVSAAMYIYIYHYNAYCS